MDVLRVVLTLHAAEPTSQKTGISNVHRKAGNDGRMPKVRFVITNPGETTDEYKP